MIPVCIIHVLIDLFILVEIVIAWGGRKENYEWDYR